MLAVEGKAHDPRTRRGIEWLLAEQEPDGAWFGRWGVNYVYGTGSVVPALVAAGLPASHPAIRRAVGWLESRAERRRRLGRGPALLPRRGMGAATAPPPPRRPPGRCSRCSRPASGTPRPCERGIAWLAETQREDGSWDEPYFTGTGFPWDFSINYHLYRQVFPLTALGRYVNGEPFAGRSAQPGG